MAKILKIAGLAAVGAGGYYIYQSQVTGKRADVLAKQDWHKITNSAEADKQDLQTQAKQQWNKLGNEADRQFNAAQKQVNDARAAAEKQVSDARAASEKTIKNFQSDASKTVGDLTDKLKGESDKANKQAKGWLDSFKGWFGGK